MGEEGVVGSEVGVELLLGVLSLGGCVGGGEDCGVISWRRRRRVSLVWRRVGGSEVHLPFRRYMVVVGASWPSVLSDGMNLGLGSRAVNWWKRSFGCML